MFSTPVWRRPRSVHASVPVGLPPWRAVAGQLPCARRFGCFRFGTIRTTRPATGWKLSGAPRAPGFRPGQSRSTDPRRRFGAWIRAPLPATGTRRIMRGWPAGGDEEPEDSFSRPVRIRHPGHSEAESRDLNSVAPPAPGPRIFAAARLVRGDEKSCRLPLRRVDEDVADDPAYRCYRFRLDPAGRMAAPMQPGAARGAAGRRDDHAGQGAGI